MTTEEIKERVMASRSTTIVAQAFRKALGLPPVAVLDEVRCVRRNNSYKGIRQCFRNFESPLDGRF